jgi:hypothetical protein
MTTVPEKARDLHAGLFGDDVADDTDALEAPLGRNLTMHVRPGRGSKLCTFVWFLDGPKPGSGSW